MTKLSFEYCKTWINECYIKKEDRTMKSDYPTCPYCKRKMEGGAVLRGYSRNGKRIVVYTCPFKRCGGVVQREE